MNVPLFEIGHANNRVARIINVHYDATADEVSNFLKDFKILDQYRTINPRTRKNSVVYVLFENARDKNASLRLKGHYIRGRKVDIMPAPTGNYRINDDYSGFVHDEQTPTLSTPQTANPAPLLFNSANFPALGQGLDLEAPEDLFQESPTLREYMASWTSEESCAHASLLAEFGTVDEDEMGEEVKEVGPKNDPKSIIWGATPDELAQAHTRTYTNLKPMPSGIEGPRQIITLGDLPYTKAQIESISVARPEHCLPGLLGSMDFDKQTTSHTRSASADKTWNLFGIQAGILTADQWYNFENDQARKDLDVREKEDNAADRINRERGMM